MNKSARASAALALAPVLRQKSALHIDSEQSNEGPLIRELCYGSLRLYPRLQLVLDKLLQKPLKDRDADIQALLIVGLYQLFYMRIPDHAVLDQTVKASVELKKKWAKGLVNAVLRNALRKREDIESALASDKTFRSAHPPWLAAEIEKAWPDQAESIFAAGNARPPMVLRVNTRQTSVDDYLEKLAAEEISVTKLKSTETGIRLQMPVPAGALPDFDAGLCSVQDEAAQWAAQILAPKPGQRVLDACAAPGGKTCHLLESARDLQLTAIEYDESRCEAIESNLARLKLDAEVVCADAADTASWWNGKPFDRILIDAPCSGTGVIRRHPDIKLLRRASDIEGFASQQMRLLEALWGVLAEDGLLLYATCSIMPAENEQQVRDFLKRHPDARLKEFSLNAGQMLDIGFQSFPTENGPDGFYYALLGKS